MLFSLSLIPDRLAMDKLTKKAKGNSLPPKAEKAAKKRARRCRICVLLNNSILFDKRL